MLKGVKKEDWNMRDAYGILRSKEIQSINIKLLLFFTSLLF